MIIDFLRRELRNFEKLLLILERERAYLIEGAARLPVVQEGIFLFPGLY
jgi:hypothetical protein